MRNRRLVLRREALSDLSTTDLADVVGGANTKTCPDYTYHCPTGPALCNLSALDLCV